MTVNRAGVDKPGAMDDLKRGHVTGRVDQLLLTALGMHRQEGQRIIATGPEHKGAALGCFFCLQEPVIHRCDERSGRAEIGFQDIVAPCGRPTRRQIAVDIRTTEPVDRLLGIADQQQRRFAIVARGAVDLVEDPILPW